MFSVTTGWTFKDLFLSKLLKKSLVYSKFNFLLTNDADKSLIETKDEKNVMKCFNSLRTP